MLNYEVNMALIEVTKLFVLWQKQRMDVNILYGVEIKLVTTR